MTEFPPAEEVALLALLYRELYNARYTSPESSSMTFSAAPAS
jgi:hypothetical protein